MATSQRGTPERELPLALELLSSDHRKVEDLFEQFENAHEAQRKKALVDEICTEL